MTGHALGQHIEDMTLMTRQDGKGNKYTIKMTRKKGQSEYKTASIKKKVQDTKDKTRQQEQDKKNKSRKTTGKSNTARKRLMEHMVEKKKTCKGETLGTGHQGQEIK